MLSVYIFSLVLGGSFLLVSVLGDVFDADADLDTDLDADVDFDAGELSDAAEAGDVGHGTDLAHASAETHAADAAHGTAAAKIFSIRGLIYALFGFGAVGSALSWLGDTGTVATLVAAVAGGLLTGGMVTLLFNWLKATSASNRHGDTGFVGLRGTVTLPVGDSSAGTVAVERGGRRVLLRALPWPGAEGDSATWRDVVVMEMERGVARVAPIEDDLALEP
ncbi:MAG: hypothetical protein GWM90_00915 [Gemmatimonadetes bacterium]|nr:hypothetical protein [Gemmatimonadota bacterium]NIQ52108.1 hypothetical protein [Gemmatimonadota bacterium]NIU72218.1 hypothetical protein [Gammaproteobacteria bacterium]NIX42741.1 hypothetical protein [Gemmatimonadota bacterium]NIY06906.1 hypothetical protein [Gemmatimonadota bacterium]